MTGVVVPAEEARIEIGHKHGKVPLCSPNFYLIDCDGSSVNNSTLPPLLLKRVLTVSEHTRHAVPDIGLQLSIWDATQRHHVSPWVVKFEFSTSVVNRME